MTIPAPQIIDPHSVPALKWGVVGPGDIADTFTDAIHRHTAQRVHAVASRTPGRAEDFAKKFGVPTVHADYEALVSDPEIHVVYIATHISDHLRYGHMAVQAGKHVLVEKPLGYTPDEAEAFFQAATAAGVFAMEAMWTRYLPQASVLRQLLNSGDLGQPEFLQVNFANDNRHIGRLWAPGSGGIVHDMGIYPIAFAQFVLGEPETVSARGLVNEHGMDQETHVDLTYASGARASLFISGISTVPCTATLSASDKMLAIDHPFFVPSGFQVASKDLYFTGERWTDTSAVQRHEGLSYQATALAQYVSEGRLESPVHPHREVVANLRTAEAICRQVGAHPWG